MDFGFSYTDWRRIFWAFVFGALSYAALAAQGVLAGDAWTWKTVIVGAVVAGFSAVKNFVLSDSSPIK